MILSELVLSYPILVLRLPTSQTLSEFYRIVFAVFPAVVQDMLSVLLSPCSHIGSYLLGTFFPSSL